jgi:Ulp1 family protease
MKSLVSDGSTQHEKGYDCGAFVCAFAEHLFLDKPMEFTQDDIPRARKHIAMAFLNERQTIEVE